MIATSGLQCSVAAFRVALTLICFPSAANLWATERPNVLLIVADDLGYADLGCYGSEIETPNLDRLASEGVRFSHFRATPMCTTSRVALMSGMTYHRAGREDYTHSIPLPMLLKSAGYRTMMVGKWHAGNPDPTSRRLFDRSFGFLGGMSDCFVGGSDWFLDDKPFLEFPAGFYSTSAFAERSIEFMREARGQQQPFFMYVAFNAPHHPCQAPQATCKKYEKTYRDGFDAIRHHRYQRQLELGMVEASWPLAPAGQEVRRWEELTKHRRHVESARMAAYAAAVDEVDQSVGRLLSFLDETGIADNTLVIFLSDNGGDYGNGGIATDEQQVAWEPHSNPSSSNGWSWVKNTPFRFYKHSCHEGGLAVPLILRWPSGTQLEGNSIVDEPCHITDLYPTVLAATGTKYPLKHKQKDTRRLTGASLLPILTGVGVRVARPVFAWYKFSRAWIENEWKAVSLYNGPWQLYHLAADRGESQNLAAKFPERLAELANKWEYHAREFKVAENSKIESLQKGWGWHRLQMVCPQLMSLTPANSTISDSTNVSLQLSFSEPVDFENTPGKKIRLFAVANESEPIWEADPGTRHPSQGSMRIDFENIPPLESGKHYFVLWDPGWVSVGGRPIGPLNDGAYWWRFRTPEHSKQANAR